MITKLRDYIWNKDNEEYLAREKYSPYALQQARNIVKYWTIDKAKHREFVEWISIDAKESKDLDDAIWAEKYSNWYKVWIHISDPTENIKKYSPLDLEALKRTTSIYRTNDILNMYPPELANDIFSLNEWREKLTITVEVDLDFEWNIKNFEVYESIFKNKKRCDYENFIDDFINPDSPFHETFQIMYEIAKKRRNNRKSKWAILDFDEADRRIFLWEKREKIITNIKKIPHQIVEEWAILWNICTAIYMTRKDLLKVFRVHLELNEKAFYSEKELWHKALALKNYTHFTSPIRRYSDGVVHRIIKDDLNNRNSLYENEELREILDHINKKALTIQYLWKYYDSEIWGKKKIELLKNLYWNDLKVNHFKIYIRNHISKNKKIPKNMIEEIKNDIESWELESWAWAIWLFLVSDEKEIKKMIYKKIIEENVMEYKKIISILNTTKIMRWDKNSIFQIEEDVDEVKNKVYYKISFQNNKIYESEYSYWNEYEKRCILWDEREKIIKKFFEIFMD